MNRFFQIFASVFLVGVVLVALFSSINRLAPITEWTNVILPDGSYVAAEVATTTEQKARGLSGRDGLAAGTGMLFPYASPEQIGIWMKDMQFPIDIVWMNQGEVVYVVEEAPVPAPGAPLPIYRPPVDATEVLELPAHYAVAHGVRTGTKILIERDQTQSGTNY